MTVRVRPTSGPKRRRSSGDSEERFQLFVTVGFIGLIVAVVLILIGAVAYAYYDSHFRPIATVGATTISRDQWATRANLELLRISNQETRIRAQVAAGQLDGTTGDTLITSLESSKQNVASTSAEDLVDLVYKGQLADAKGLSVSDADIQARMNADASNPERRHVYAIFLEPQPATSTAAVTAKDRQKALENATAAAAALAQRHLLRGGCAAVQHRSQQEPGRRLRLHLRVRHGRPRLGPGPVRAAAERHDAGHQGRRRHVPDRHRPRDRSARARSAVQP